MLGTIIFLAIGAIVFGYGIKELMKVIALNNKIDSEAEAVVTSITYHEDNDSKYKNSGYYMEYKSKIDGKDRILKEVLVKEPIINEGDVITIYYENGNVYNFKTAQKDPRMVVPSVTTIMGVILLLFGFVGLF